MTPRGAFALVIGIAAVVSGCELPPRGAVDLRDAEIEAVHLTTLSGRPTICPGSDVPLTVEVDARIPGESDVVHLHGKRETIEDWVFEPRALRLTSKEGTVDGDAVFHASADPVASASEGFLVDVHPPHRPAYGIRFAPSYECVRRIGHAGVAGLPGSEGEYGAASYTVAGGGLGGTGSAGGAGGPGPSRSFYVTWVSTPYVPRAIAIWSDGDDPPLTLADADASITLVARGGDGGEGGRGGTGGHGEDGKNCWRAHSNSKYHCTNIPYEPAGPGGQGGVGGAGGAGGQLVVHVDARYPDLAGHLVLDVHGGRGGAGGRAGAAGERREYDGFGFASDTRPDGAPGTPGPNGLDGPDGSARIVYEDVVSRFAGMPAVRPFP